MAASSSPVAALSNSTTAADASNYDVDDEIIGRPIKRLKKKPQEENKELQQPVQLISSSSSSPSSSIASSRCIDNSSSSSSSLNQCSATTTVNGNENSDGSNGGGGPSSSIIDLCISRLFHALPQTLLAPENNNAATDHSDDDKVSAFRSQWTNHGFRTTVVSSPRCAVSVYLDSCRSPPKNNKEQQIISSKEKSAQQNAGRQFLLTCIGMHTDQLELESNMYQSVLKKCWCFKLFLDKLTRVREHDMREESVDDVVKEWKDELTKLIGGGENYNGSSSKYDVMEKDKRELLLQQLSNKVPTMLSNLIVKLTDIDHSLRIEQLLQEYNRIEWENSSLANACLQRWLSSSNGCQYDLDQVYFKFSPPGRYTPKYERITIYFKNDNEHHEEISSSKLTLIPSLTQILNRDTLKAASHPIDTVVQDMIQTTWDALLHNGYYVDQTRKDQLTPSLSKFYTSGLIGGNANSNNNNSNNVMPLLLNAHFTPTYPLSLYLYGLAGSGKSSLVRNLFVAMNAAIAKYCDPELLVRFVKQNLNKPYSTLELELELRPNNNDYSVMSIIQGRRMTLTQSKPGLVVVGLEEMPSNVEGSDPRQCDVSSLLSYRFSGRKGDFKSGGAIVVAVVGGGTTAPRNSSKRGISGDATIITIFTSNYELEPSSFETLSKLEMFQNLSVVKIEAVSGRDRHSFALSYLYQRVKETTVGCKSLSINLDIECGEGDTRPLVRFLRMLSFFICALLKQQQRSDTGRIDVAATQDEITKLTQITNNQSGDSMQLKCGSFQNLYAATPCTLDPRASDIVVEMQKSCPNLKDPTDLIQILDFYFARTLAPVVILSQNKELISDLTAVISRLEGVKAIRNIDPSSYKIMRSLYDPSDTPNLRDDILRLQRDGGDQSLVTIELVCRTSDSQMVIREIIEDTPSMTAFSSERSALYKDGLLFCVYVEGDITPEIASRASLVI